MALDNWRGIEALTPHSAAHVHQHGHELAAITWSEVVGVSLLVAVSLAVGLYPKILLDAIEPAVKAILAGAHAVQIVSALLRNGPKYLAKILEDLKTWMEDNEYQSIRQMQGSLSLARCPDPAAFERGNYMRVLNSWHS